MSCSISLTIRTHRASMSTECLMVLQPIRRLKRHIEQREPRKRLAPGRFAVDYDYCSLPPRHSRSSLPVLDTICISSNRCIITTRSFSSATGLPIRWGDVKWRDPLGFQEGSDSVRSWTTQTRSDSSQAANSIRLSIVGHPRWHFGRAFTNVTMYKRVGKSANITQHPGCQW